MNRILRRPMFKMGGSAEGITSGLQPRKKFAFAGTVDAMKNNENTPKADAGMSIMEKLQSQKSIIDTLSPRQPRTDTSMRDFLINFGLDIASRPPSGSIFSTAAASAKEPFGKFQQAKQIEDAYSMKEIESDRALIANMIKGMDEDTLSALMKDVKAGVEAGLFADENEGIRKLLQKKIYGVMDEPGEAEKARIRDLELMIARDQEVPAGMVKAVAQHIYKIETDAYPEDVRADLNRTRTFIKPLHMSAVKRDEDGEISEIIIDGNYKTFYVKGQIYFDAQTGDLFKNVSVENEAPRFVRVDFE